jgi:DNA-binding MarR family transcriptional regulator
MNDPKLESIVSNLLSIVPQFHRKLIRLDELLAAQDIAPSHLKIMFLLDACGELTVSEIGEKLYISRPNVTPLIDKLVKEGMAERIRDSSDKRIFNVKPTVKGKEFISNQKNMLTKNLKRRLSVMSDDTLDKLDLSLVVLKETLEKITS